MDERLSGQGKVFNGQKYISDVQYELEIYSHYRDTQTLTGSGKLLVGKEVRLRINPRAALSGQVGTDRLTLQMSDGRKQDFFVTSSSGECKATGGPHD